MRRFQWLVAAGLVGVLGGCAQQPHLHSQMQLPGTAWQLDMLGERPALPPRPMLTFDAAGNAAGQGSCNRYSAQVTIAGDAIAFGPIAATRMACGGAVDAQESAYFDRLGKATRIAVDSRVLKVYSSDDPAPLLFLRVPAP